MLQTGKTSWAIAAVLCAAVITAFSEAHAAPAITSIGSGPLVNGSAVTILGSGFGNNGPNILVFDDFEGGADGSLIKTGAGSATIGKWDEIGGGTNTAPPHYSSLYRHSGNLAFKSDLLKVTDGSNGTQSRARITNLSYTDAFVSFWNYWPATSSFPCASGGSACNIKMTWLFQTTAGSVDFVNQAGQPEGYNSWSSGPYTFCNSCGINENYTSPRASISKGKWYRHSTWVHATSDASSNVRVNVISPAGQGNLTNVERINWTGKFIDSAGLSFTNFALSAWYRTCVGCAESSPFFDDVYMAIGPSARARVEIGDASTYGNCTNLSIATVTSWSDTAVTATVRQGSFTNFNSAYIYVIDANGNVNQSGFRICPNCPLPPVWNP